ncbi:MAG TPA: FAD-binding oxidoreductase [Steroidobacteraceae bacterium]|jgi:FAD/FMN-containing dehydrogenase|nr:FAD-binding oxidoreductase [Steroidobacteraceae bacterium]
MNAQRRPLDWVNDTHSSLNRTPVAHTVEPKSVAEVVRAVRAAREQRLPVAISGGRHAMGGQQFLSGGTLLDMRRMNRVRRFEDDLGLIEVEAGITWPDVIRGYLVRPNGAPSRWGIRQKQTGADRLTIGGAVAANIHGRCLTAAPFIADLEALEVVTGDGQIVRCSRIEHPELFRHVVGGYGLFGVVTAATLRLVPRLQVERIVQLLDVDRLIDKLETHIAEGCLYGDFQFATDPTQRGFLRTGVLSCYRPVERARPIPARQRRLSQADWNRLLELAHCDKRRAFDEFAAFYLSTSGQLYWSDTHQLNLYLESYHGALDVRLGRGVRGSEMITELYVPRRHLTAFMDDVRKDFRANDVDFIYGTIRLIEPDTESALPWARERYACVIFNLHVDHVPRGIVNARAAFTRLIDHAIAYGGSYYLTYHRFARRDQLLTCHPALEQFLAAKRRFDPAGVFQSDWYHHISAQLAGTLG